MWGKELKKFEHPRYRINRILLGVVGLWPYQSKFESRSFQGTLIVSSIVLISAAVRKIILEDGRMSIVLETVPPFLIDFLVATNMINIMFSYDKLYQLMEHIEADWSVTSGMDAEILAKYADGGWTVIVVYSLWLYVSATFFLGLPLLPNIIDAAGLMNISATAQFPFPVDYYVDSDEYYVYLQIHICVTSFWLITVIVSTDVLFVMLIQHSCGKFAAICYRLEHLIESDDLELDLHPARVIDVEFWIISDCIRKHNEAIQFAETLEIVFSWSFFFQLGINMALFVFTAVQMVWNMGSVDVFVRQALLTGAGLLHFFFECYFSQRLTDHSLQIFEALNKTKWYKTSIRSRQLLIFMIMRSMKPCLLNAGTVYTMSMENFSVAVRSSMSYFTILCTAQ